MSRKLTTLRAKKSPAASEIPPSAPALAIEDVVPDPHIISPSLENIPEDILTENEQLADELDHEALEQQLPGEDCAPAEHD